jgi:uncharacterized protein
VPQPAPGPLHRYLKFILTRALIILVGVYVALFVYIDINQDQFTFPASRNYLGDYPHETPASAGMSFEDLRIPVNSTGYLHAWYVPAAQPSSKVILFFHGNGYNIEQSVRGELTGLHQTGANLLMADYRGYGGSSPGQENGVRASEDARAALHYLVGQRGVPVGNIIITGRSIGTGVASQLALENSHAAGLILLSAFTSVNAAARQEGPLMRFLPLELMGSRNSLDTLAKIASIHMPLLLVVGTEDTLTPPWMARALFAKANEPKQLYVIPGAGHNDLWLTGGRPLIARLMSFVASFGPQ